MKYIDAEKLKAKIERVKAEHPTGSFGESFEGGFDAGYSSCCCEIADFLSTLESEKPIIPDKEFEMELDNYVGENGLVNCSEIVPIARHFYETGCRRAAEMYDEIEYERQRAEESVSNDLEDAAVDIADALLAKPKNYALSAKADYWNGAHDGVIAGAKWQYQKDREEFAKIKAKTWCEGFDACKEQMVENALHGWLDEDNEPPYDLNVVCEEKIPFGEFKHSDKVRIIIEKEDWIC